MKQAVIVGAARTAIGGFNGTLKNVTAPQLGTVAIKAALERAGVNPDAVTEVIMGNVVSAAIGQAPARQAAIGAGVPTEAGALTINKVCGSGLKAVMLAAQAIMLGDEEVVVAGGMESMSQVPYALTQLRAGARMGHAKTLDLMIHDGLWCPFEDYHMGHAGELIAGEYNISRKAQDAYAAASQNKAETAVTSGRFKDEIVPVPIPQRKGDPVIFDTDEQPRFGTTPEKLGRLRAAFKKDGTVTAGNAPSVNDAAAAVIVTSEERAKKEGWPILAKIKGYATGGIDPAHLLLAPIVAIKKLNKKLGLKGDEYELIELNEAFSVQSMVTINELGWDADKVNVNGGAVALGHPIGASGTRILVTLLFEMEKRDSKLGLASLCLGGGNGVAMALERP